MFTTNEEFNGLSLQYTETGYYNYIATTRNISKNITYCDMYLPK